MNKYVIGIILTLALVGTVAMQNASAQKSAASFFGDGKHNNWVVVPGTETGTGTQPKTIVQTQRAHITISNLHFVTTHHGLIGPSHYELQGTMTNDGTQTSPMVILRMYIERNGGTPEPIKTFLAATGLSAGASQDFGIPFTSDEVNAYHPDRSGKIVTDTITYKIGVYFAEEQGELQG